MCCNNIKDALSSLHLPLAFSALGLRDEADQSKRKSRGRLKVTTIESCSVFNTTRVEEDEKKFISIRAKTLDNWREEERNIFSFFLFFWNRTKLQSLFELPIDWFLIISKQLPLQTRLTPFSFLLLFSQREYLTPHWIIRDDNSRHYYHPYITRRVERNYSSALLKDTPPSFFIFDFRISSFQGGISARDALWGKGRCRLCSKLA